MYRQILVFSDAQGKSITWRLSAKKNIPAPERLTYTGRVLVRFVGVYGDNNDSTMGKTWLLYQWSSQWSTRGVSFNAAVPVARIINQKVAQGYIRRAQILFMKVKRERQNAARKA